ncbi:hypothetical protein G6F68_011478 [Rhizopus microsporus]|nr:hypothetical protein G6F68_011478 [Rhizopus microsporus]
MRCAHSFFIEQAAERIIAPGIEGDVQAQARGEGHFAQCGEGTTVAAVVVGQQQAGLARIADQFEEAPQALWVVQLRGGTGKGRQIAVVGMYLGQDRTAQALLAGTEADQPHPGRCADRPAHGRAVRQAAEDAPRHRAPAGAALAGAEDRWPGPARGRPARAGAPDRGLEELPGHHR